MPHDSTAAAPAYATRSERPRPVAALWVVWCPEADLRGAPLLLRPGATERIGRLPTLPLRVDDPWMSKEHFEVTADAPDSHGRPRWRVRDLGTRNGTRVNGLRVLGERVVCCGDAIRAGATLMVADEGLAEAPSDLGLIGLSAALAEIRHTVRRYASAEVMKPVSGDVGGRPGREIAVPLPIHVTGPSGAGKEQVARAIHAASGRRGRLVPRNISTIAPKLIESELFGYTKGAFTGAERDRPGLLDAAADGTLFLDEIAELPAELQPKLLSVVDYGEVTPVGSTSPHYVSARVVTATLKDLAWLAAAGELRQDLYHRLTGAVITVPPLSERRLDVVPLALHFLDRAGGMTVRERAESHQAAPYWLADLLEPALLAPWQGNVRQLQAWAARTAALLAPTWPAEGGALPDPTQIWREATANTADLQASGEPAQAPLPQQQREEITELFDDPDALAQGVVEMAGGNIKAFSDIAAAALGIKPTSARRKVYDVLGPDRVARLRRSSG